MQLSLQYLIREPKLKFDKNPMVLMLHGYGSNEQDLFSFAEAFPENYYIISARAPFDLQYESYAWYAINFDADENKFSDLDQAQTSRDLICKFIDELTTYYPIDTQNSTLVGFSQGAILSYAIGVSYPEKVRKIVAMSGYFNEKIAKDNYQKNNFDTLNIFASHGSVDQVVPVEWARKAKPALTKLGIDMVYNEYPVGHTISQQNFFDMITWLQKD